VFDQNEVSSNRHQSLDPLLDGQRVVEVEEDEAEVLHRLGFRLEWIW
jgi:hypothetical protein